MRFITDDDPGEPGTEYRYYVSVIDDDDPRNVRSGILAGPYTTKADAAAHEPEARNRARDADQRAHWYAYGICRAPATVTLRPVFGLL